MTYAEIQIYETIRDMLKHALSIGDKEKSLEACAGVEAYCQKRLRNEGEVQGIEVMDDMDGRVDNES